MEKIDRDLEEIQSEQMRDEKQKPSLLPYNESANGGRWWEDQK